MRKGSKHIKDYRGSIEQRFWDKVQKTSTCWNWLGAINFKGYGALRLNGKNVFPHRFSYELHKGKIPKGIFVCHNCDNSKCVNPSHLWLGTNYDNVQDMVKKMRHTMGERNGMAKLTESQVKKIRQLHKNKIYNGEELSKMFKVGRGNISQIVNYKYWKYI